VNGISAAPEPMKALVRSLLVLALLWLTWIAWQPPQTTVHQQAVKATLPAMPSGAGSTDNRDQWRVVTRRIVWGEAVKTLEQRFGEAGLTPIKIKTREPVIMHAFDDGRIFQDFKEAAKIKSEWEKQKVDADVIKVSIEVGKTVYMVGLGRFYLTEYAEQMQNRLRQVGKPYRYEQRTVELPVWRFTFPPSDKASAAKLWEKLQDLGVASPTLMPQDKFEEIYGKR